VLAVFFYCLLTLPIILTAPINLGFKSARRSALEADDNDTNAATAADD